MSDPRRRLPADLPARLPATTLESGTDLFRIHRRDRDPIWYGPKPGEPPSSRFDDPNEEYRTLYAALTEEGAFAETFLRDRSRVRVLSLGEAEKARISALTCARSLRMATLHGPGARRMGADAGVASGPYSTSRPWGRAIWEHADDVDGILYRARHDDDLLSVAVFDRVPGSVVPAGPPERISQDVLARMAARYGFGIVP